MIDHYDLSDNRNKYLIIFSGLPGTGKSELAKLLAKKLQITLLSIDDVVAAIPDRIRKYANPFWDEMIFILLHLAEYQLEKDFSIIIDSVFMGYDRHQAYEIAKKHNAIFRPIYLYFSDERIWKERVTQRIKLVPEEIKDRVATWESITEQRKLFAPWSPGSALFIDSVNAIGANLSTIIQYILTEEKS